MQTRRWLKRELGTGVRMETERRESGGFFFLHVCVCEKTKHSVDLLTTVRHTGWNGTIQTTSPRVSTAQTFPEPTAHSPAKNTAQRGNKTSWDHLYSLSTRLDAIHNSLYYSFFFSPYLFAQSRVHPSLFHWLVWESRTKLWPTRTASLTLLTR